ncbi:MAG: hypothetical protein QW058_02115 [Candidatus Aenigmatarchaeota archaeon]
MNKLGLISILLFFLILPEVKAISLGSVLKKDFVILKANESARFEILFWNVEEEPFQVKIEVKEAPKDWSILIQPQEFLLSSSSGEEYINLPNLENPVKAKLVKIFVKPENSKAGEYEVVLKARAGAPSQGIAFFQEIELKLRVKVEGESEKTKSETPAIWQPLPSTGKIVEETSSILSYISAIIFILVVSFLIYKYA